MQFLSYPSTGPIFIDVGISTSPFQTLLFRPYLYTHSNSYLILLNFEIWTLFLYKLEFSSYRLKHCHSRPVFIPLAFLCYPSKRSNFDPILIHICVLILSLKTLVFWPFFGTYWNSYLILPNIGILISSFQIMEFWPFFYKHWNYDLIHSNVEFLIL